MNPIIFVAVCTLLEISRTSARPNNEGINSQEFSKTERMAADPRYVELRKEAENIVKNAIQNVRVENLIDITRMTYGPGECNEEAIKEFVELKDKTFQLLADCPDRVNLEQETWALGISAVLLVEQIQRATQDSFKYCMKQKKSKNVICKINPEDEASKKFETLKGKVDLLAVSASKMYTDIFLPLVEKCLDEKNMKASLESIKSNCPGRTT